MTKHIGATVALVFIVVLIMGSLIMSTPTGKKTVNFLGEMATDGSLQNMMSSQNSLNCITGGCGMPSTGMSMFSK
jgi:uncharacterized membrane protein